MSTEQIGDLHFHMPLMDLINLSFDEMSLYDLTKEEIINYQVNIMLSIILGIQTARMNFDSQKSMEIAMHIAGYMNEYLEEMQQEEREKKQNAE